MSRHGRAPRQAARRLPIGECGHRPPHARRRRGAAAGQAVHHRLRWSTPASEVPSESGQHRPAAAYSLMPTGLPGPSSMKCTLGSRSSTGLALLHLVAGDDAATDHLLGRYVAPAQTARRNSTPRNDVSPVAAGAQVAQQLHHRLVGHLAVQPTCSGSWLSRHCRQSPRTLAAHAGVRGHHHLDDRLRPPRAR